LYLANSLAAAVNEPALYRLLTFHVPNKISLFLCLPRDTSSRNTPPPPRSEWGLSLPPDCFVSRGSNAPCEYFLTWGFWRGGVVSSSPNPQAGGPPLVGCPRLLIQYIRSYPPYRSPFLHPQPEDAPFRGDRDPLTRNIGITLTNITSGYQAMFLIFEARHPIVLSYNNYVHSRHNKVYTTSRI
jgi:hypothetical protein